MPLVLGGVAIDHPRGLAGHSDGDVIAHALTDALLGGAGLADIGALFPSTTSAIGAPTRSSCSPRPTGRCGAAGYALVNADCVLIGQEPRIAPLRDAMSERLAAALGVERGRDRRSGHDHRLPRLHRPGRRPRCAGSGAARTDPTRDPPLLHLRRAPRAPRREPGSSGRRGRAFMLESPISNERWHLLYERFGGFQFWLVDEATDEILAEGNSLPVRLDLADLPTEAGSTSSSTRRTATRSPRSSRRSRCSSTAIATDRRPQRAHAGRDAPDRPRRQVSAISWLPCGRA